MCKLEKKKGWNISNLSIHLKKLEEEQQIKNPKR